VNDLIDLLRVNVVPAIFCGLWLWTTVFFAITRASSRGRKYMTWELNAAFGCALPLKYDDSEYNTAISFMKIIAILLLNGPMEEIPVISYTNTCPGFHSPPAYG